MRWFVCTDCPGRLLAAVQILARSWRYRSHDDVTLTRINGRLARVVA
jgi:hypothetical protein